VTPAKKTRERFLLDRFLSVKGLNPSEITSSEAPDFVLKIDSKLIGIEITEAFLEASVGGLTLRAHESLTDRILSKAKKLYDGRANTPAHISIAFFSPQISLKLNRDELSLAIAELVQDLMIGANGHVHWRNVNDHPDSRLNAVAFITVLPVDEAEHGRWNVARAGWVAPLTNKHLAPIVERKNARYATYKRHLDQVWLLIAIDGGAPSQMFDLKTPVNLASLGSDFDKTFFLRTWPPLLLHHEKTAINQPP
jgi:hypothetical protein